MDEPKPEQFGLTPEEYQQIKAENARTTKRLAILGVIISLLISIGFIVDIVSTNYHPIIFTILPATFIMLPVFLVGGSGLTMAAIKLYFYQLKMNDPDYRKFLEYDSARQEYEELNGTDEENKSV
jgi:hypothetical protein